MKRMAVLIGGIGVALLALWWVMGRNGPGSEAMMQGAQGDPIVKVVMPELSGDAALGALAFKGKCAACHGEDAGGRKGMGPPLIHKIYFPGHHSDMAIYQAARQGAKQHHWPFGDMPPVKGITDADIKVIIAYIRTVQRANGIY
jgi:mono/diheme cytochrome c family protein